MNGTKRTHYLACGGSLVLMFVFLALFVKTRSDVLLVIGLIMMNAAFQLISRLFIGTLCEGAFENGVNSSSDWYKTTEFEERLYGSLMIKKLKAKLPKTENTGFTLKKSGVQDIIDSGCIVESEHEVCILTSMLGILLAIPFGYVGLFIAAAVIGVVYDLLFVCVQRYNRPRLITANLKLSARFFEKMEAAKLEEGSDSDENCDNLQNNQTECDNDDNDENGNTDNSACDGSTNEILTDSEEKIQ